MSTKPSELAVGVRYVPGQPAPRVLFRAKGEQAARVLLLAKKFGVPVDSQPDLAPLLYQLPEGSWIPEKHFQVLAQLLATVYHQSRKSP